MNLKNAFINRYPAKLLVFWEKIIYAQLLNVADDVFIICKQKTIDNCIWNLSLKFIVVRILWYLVPVIGKHMISRIYAYVEHSEIKTKTVNIIQFLTLIYAKMSKSVMYLIHWRVQGIPNANWHTFMVWIKERFLCHVYYIQMDICEHKWMNALSMLTVVNK